MDPINYGALLPQIDFTGLQRGMAMREQRRETQQLVEARRAAADLASRKYDDEIIAKQVWAQDVGALLKNPTAEGYRELFLKHPGQLDALKAGLEGYNAGQVTRNRNAAMEVLGLVNAGATGVAVKKLKDRRDALAEAGESTEITDTLIADLESGEPERISRAKGTAAFALYPMLGDQADEIFATLGMGAKAEDQAADNARQDRALDLRERRDAATDARADRREQRADAREARADRREARLARGGGSGGADGYEYRIGPTGKLQRRKVR